MPTAAIDFSAVWSPAPSGAGPIELASYFADGPVELEIGSGKGLFLLREAQRRPKVSFLGVEWSRKYAQFAALRIAKRSLPNVRVVTADARLLLPRFADRSFAALHVYFPDPWWKRRHRKRRLVTTGFVDQAARLIGSGGVLSLATDVEEYFTVMLNTVGANAAFARLPWQPPADPATADDYLTNFERKYLQQGRSIYRVAYQRV